MRILLGTDNKALATLMQRALSRFRYQWIFVDNGFDAFQKAISRKFDLVILEYGLPRMNAIEIMRRFGALENFRQPPVIVLTLNEDEREHVEKEHFHRTEVLSRPIAVRQFVQMSHRYLLFHQLQIKHFELQESIKRKKIDLLGNPERGLSYIIHPPLLYSLNITF